VPGDNGLIIVAEGPNSSETGTGGTAAGGAGAGCSWLFVGFDPAAAGLRLDTRSLDSPDVFIDGRRTFAVLPLPSGAIDEDVLDL
jgi:hypothetical protein